MNIEKFILFALLLGVVLTSVSTFRFETETIPDSTVTRHGLPLFWLHHQTSSIAGPVDIWSVHWAYLVLDFALWFIISATMVYVVDRLRT